MVSLHSEIGQCAELVERVSRVVVSLQGIGRPVGDLGDQTLYLGMGQHSGTSFPHLKVVIGSVE
jgi:hypothetical protein